MKYIDAERLRAEIEKRYKLEIAPWLSGVGAKSAIYDHVMPLIDSLQQDKDVLDLCSQVWWEERGWIMIPPNVTLKGIESLLERVRHKIKWNEENGLKEQEPPEVDLEEYIKNEINHYGLSLYEASYGTFSASQIDRIIRNAFNLGLNAREEE